MAEDDDLMRAHQGDQEHSSLKQRLDERREKLKAAKSRYKEAQQIKESVGMKLLFSGLELNAQSRRTPNDPEIERRRAEIEAGQRAQAAKVNEALEQLEEAADAYEEAHREFLVSTVEPRVEAEKLRFEEHKLRATLSSASIVGIAATAGVLLPDRLSYVPVLVVAFLCLFLSTVLSLSAMKETSSYVESTLISGDVHQPKSLRALLTRHTFTAGLVFFALFVTLNLT